jgi:rhamnosyltransferase subunit B
MHFTISPFGSAGDVHPFLGLALKLRERGHDVLFLTTGYFEEAVRRHGLEYLELGTKEEFLEAINNPELWSQSKSFAHVFNGVASVFRRHYDVLAEQHQRRKTVAISSCLGFGARIAQESLRIPLISIHLQPAVIHSKLQPPMLAGIALPRWFTNAALMLGERFVLDRVAFPELNRFRTELGLQPVRGLMSWWHSTDKNICLFPHWFAPKQLDWPNHTELADFPLWDVQTDEALPSDVQSFLEAGTPPIVFTPGSANIFGTKFFQAAADACLKLGRRGMLLSRFPAHIPTGLPSSVRHFAYVPFARLLPHTAAVVHHGGVGTTAQALAAGVPQLIMAMAHDQFDNGARIKRLGVGDWLYPRQFRAGPVAKRLNCLLESTHLRSSCQKIAEKLVLRNGLELAANSIEEFLTSHQTPDGKAAVPRDRR